MATIYYEQHGDIARLKGKQVAILGYGSQGHAHALNLKESGVSVVVGLYPGSPSGDKAKAAGLRVLSVEEAAKSSDVMMMPLLVWSRTLPFRFALVSSLMKPVTSGSARAFPPSTFPEWQVSTKKIVLPAIASTVLLMSENATPVRISLSGSMLCVRKK